MANWMGAMVSDWWRRLIFAIGQERTQAEGDELTSKLTFVATESGAARFSGLGEACRRSFLGVQ
jgi:hypothetical protein